MNFRPKTWMLVLTGALMTIISALLVHYVVSANMNKMGALEEEKAMLQASIESFWKNSNRVESNLNTAVILLESATEETMENARDLTKEYLSSTGKSYEVYNSEIHSKFVIGESKKYRAGIIDKIEDLYVNQLVIADEMSEIEEDNSFYKNLALFLQVFGLILVLSRDFGVKK